MTKIALAMTCAVGAAGMAAGSANAATVIQASAQGWYDASGNHTASNSNTITGYDNNTEYHSFYVFDLTNAAQASAISITFAANNGTYRTTGSSESIALFDYTGSVATLKANASGAAGITTFNDLGTGNQLGSYTITGSSRAMPAFTVDLSTAFIDQYNNAIASSVGSIALGVALTSYTAPGAQTYWSGSSTKPAASLSVTASVPEPASWAMMVGGFGLVGGALRRRKVAVRFA